MLNKTKIKEIEIFAMKIRLETIKAMATYGNGHIGGALSMVDALAVLYGEAMNIDPKNPRMEKRDRFVLSKGHAGPGLYATLALKGYFPIEQLATLNQNGTILPSHCDMNKTPGIDISTGSLGQGFSTAIGMAMASKIQGIEFYTYVMLGDGECNEGQIWEGFLCGAHHKVNNLIAFVDNNKKQLDGDTKDICDLGNLNSKFADFNWYTQQVDGHDISAIYEAIENAKSQKLQPSVIILDTIKGKGCKLAEDAEWNHAMAFSTPELIAAINCEIDNLQSQIVKLEEERCLA